MIAVAPPSFRRERALIKRGVWPVAGCDEAGRGPLAGPVVAAAVVLDPEADPERHRRFQAADGRAPRGTVRGNLRDRVLCGRLRLAGADRSRQYPARLAVGAGARGACAAGNAETCVRRRPRPDRHALRLRRRDRRRRPRDVDRGGLDHRQGDARPADVRAGAGLPGLRFRDPQRLRRAGASARRWTGSGRPSITAASSRRSSPRAKNITPLTDRTPICFTVDHDRSPPKIPSEVSATV